MFAEATDIDRDGIVEALRDLWGITVATLDYEPVGFGSHHYVVRDDADRRWFLTVDDLRTKDWIAPNPADAFLGLERAFGTASALREAGLGFVNAAKPRVDDRVLAPVGDSYSLAVFAFIEGRPGSYEETLSAGQRRTLLAALGRLHGSSDHVDLPRRDELDIPLRTELLRSMDEIVEPWSAGPFSQAARDLLGGAVAAVYERLAIYDDLARQVGADRGRWVVTHGEPHPGNLIWTDEGLVLIDWDTVASGPPERDLWMVEVADDLDAYAAAGGVADIRPEGIRLYELWWSLAEVAGYIHTLRSEHHDDANTRQALAGLREHLTR